MGTPGAAELIRERSREAKESEDPRGFWAWGGLSEGGLDGLSGELPERGGLGRSEDKAGAV
ncbi:hypothetical protein AKJ09_04322 [Labilithrix luteola]|uniref:Uncharacterized protein n=1 Tax=Labilithrix luteola TaxID=1391654 RepID=A0A0K1PVV4_9BACT|nr:hypothetical protein AKJ09_04322 [Labilithrix luteola]